LLRPLDWPAIKVDTSVPATVLDRMIARTEAGFRKLGETEPHWSVLTADRFRAANIATTKQEFYRTGEEVIGTVWRVLARAGVQPDADAIGFELGCGVGRLTIPLSARVGRIVAADISAPHLRLAAQAIAEAKRPNIDLRHLVRLADLDTLPELDFFFSLIVLQHNPPPVMGALLRKLLGRLRPGGIAYFQIPTYILGYSFVADTYLGRPPLEIEMHCFPQPALYRLLDTVGCSLVEVREDSSAGESLEIISNTVVVQRRG
jgi:SAM-dependent methyltransferase